MESPKTAKMKKAGKENRLGLDVLAYKGGKSTLCAGCGHNAISERILQSFFEMNIDPYQVAKFSGIGCSSKSPAYFLNRAHGFNSVHGRMPSVATGALLANRRLIGIGVSGDGDTASIGIGQFVHLMRRNLPFIYIVEDNGCYGLTKGQFSATADVGSVLKTGAVNAFRPIDLCLIAIELGATFVARSFSGDRKQLSAILKAAISHPGLAMIDVISPCVTFNDHTGSTKSFAYVREHDELFDVVDFVPYFEEIHVDYDPGTTIDVKMPDGSHILLSKIPENYSPHDRNAAMHHLIEANKNGEIITGIFYVNPEEKTLFDILHLGDTPLVDLPENVLRPGPEVLEEVMEGLG